MTRHPARDFDVATLRTELDARVATGAVHVDRRGSLALYRYSNRCMYDKRWDDYALLARGLIIDTACDARVATPFAKFSASPLNRDSLSLRTRRCRRCLARSASRSRPWR